LRPEEGETVLPEAVKLAVAQLRRHFSYLVLDTGSNFSDPVLAALECSDKILLPLFPGGDGLARCARMSENSR